jgi:hypothetical protein
MPRSYGTETASASAGGSPSMKEIHWLAGYLEGEGSFYRRPQKYGSMTVKVSATDLEPLEKCVHFFGGKVNGPYHSGKNTEKKYWQWNIHGPRALGVALTVLTLLSPRRQEQVQTMLQRELTYSTSKEN